ncbi:Hsp70 family protein [Paenibacillus koleovorans]|uniref:Hsp70 family protein n=1 Tax=Paenibacillus koleovorans TaxID=121608 RepID=UPI000FDA252B|nr:Hsp70 family protein [Paenibacillus koleovorans]
MTSNRERRMESFRPIVGIDLGTTNSAVAYIAEGKPQILPSPRGERIIPSVVLIDPQGRAVVGEDARAALVAMPDRSLAAVKRRMGSTEPLLLAGQALLPQEISALILKELKSYVDELHGEGDKEAVITVPAYFTDEQRRATKEAGELAGFVVERIINEPTAAALAFGLDNLENDQTFLVYDLGGGTFDVSVVELMSGVLEVRASTGNRMLGGEDFDWKLVDWLAERMIAEHGVDPRDDLRARALLKEKAEDAKKLLSSQETVSLAIPLVTVKHNTPIGLHVELTRTTFVSLIDAQLLESMDKVRQVLDDAGLHAANIDEVLLVGGSTRIPRVSELIVDLFGKAPRTDVNPDEAVALGAAVQAGLKSGALSDSGLVATDVAPFSMGIAVLTEGRLGAPRAGGFAPIIPRNTTIPVTRTKRFSTSAPGQTAVSIEVYQGEHEWVKHNHRLGEFLLEGLPANYKSLEPLDVTFRYNLNGILEVTAQSPANGKAMTVTVQDALNRESKEALQESAERLQKLWDQAPAEEPDDLLSEQEELMELEQWLDEEMDDEERTDEESPTVLHEEAQLLIGRVRDQLDQLESSAKTRALREMERLEQAMEAGDIDRLQQLIDDMTDFLIELEL